jgi:hypothetical protein
VSSEIAGVPGWAGDWSSTEPSMRTRLPVVGVFGEATTEVVVCPLPKQYVSPSYRLRAYK